MCIIKVGETKTEIERVERSLNTKPQIVGLLVICGVVKPTPHLNYFHVDHPDHPGLFQVSSVQQTKNQIGIWFCWFLCSPECCFGFVFGFYISLMVMITSTQCGC